jgi:Cft2 family RNA processing exonuclease
MLDCGISHSFDFKKYREAAHELKDLKLVLISHSALEYSGAYPFLISELGLNPKIFYTTQPIMRYSPLNLHEELLNLRLDRYNKKIFNKIYSEYEEMNLVKPFQKKELQLNSAEEGKMVEERSETLRETDKKIHFCCYLAGGYLGSVYWRISYGLINIIYLVDYNNYAMHHIGGLDLDNLKSQSTHLLITDACSQRVEDMKKDKLYQSLKQKIVEFFVGSGLDPAKPGGFSPKNDPKMLIPCYPTELTVEILATVRKVVADLQQGCNSIEKIGMIHLSSRYL